MLTQIQSSSWPVNDTDTHAHTNTLYGPVQAYDCVGKGAVDRACHILTSMLEHATQDVRAQLCANDTCVGIIGRHQVTTDIPEHVYLKLFKGRACAFWRQTLRMLSLVGPCSLADHGFNRGWNNNKVQRHSSSQKDLRPLGYELWRAAFGCTCMQGQDKWLRCASAVPLLW